MHRTIPIFIPQIACPFRCIYCNQFLISGQQQMPSKEEILTTIRTYLQTFPSGTDIELGFFGGTFTGLPLEDQEYLLSIIQPFLKDKSIQSIRLSTHPNYISPANMELLVRNGVRTVELGVQSLDPEVLQKVHRGYTPDDVVRAADIVKSAGLELGMQMMIGLPGDTAEKSLQTARTIVELGCQNTRIYPTLVVKNTMLAKMYEKNQYQPLTIDEAVVWTAPVLSHFITNGITVLRVGLHPTEGFINGTDYLAGPFHVSFKELVESELFRQQFQPVFPTEGKSIEIHVSPQKVNSAAGYRKSNRRWIESRFNKVRIVADPSLKNYDFTFVAE